MSRNCWTVKNSSGEWFMHVIDNGPARSDLEADYRALNATLAALKAMKLNGSFRIVGHSPAVSQLVTNKARIDETIRPLRNEARLLIGQLKKAGCKINIIN